MPEIRTISTKRPETHILAEGFARPVSTLLRQFARCESERRPSILQRINLSEAKKVMQNSRRQGRLYCCAGRFKIVWASFPAIHILRIMPTKNYPPPRLRLPRASLLILHPTAHPCQHFYCVPRAGGQHKCTLYVPACGKRFHPVSVCHYAQRIQ